MAHRDGRRGFGSRVWLGIAALLLVACAATYAEDMLVPVYVDGTLRKFKPRARVRDGTTYAPLRAAAEAVGAEVKWHAASQTAIVCLDTRCVPVRKDQGIMVEGRLLIPLRLMAAALACDVSWDAGAKAVRITTANCGPSG